MSQHEAQTLDSLALEDLAGPGAGPDLCQVACVHAQAVDLARAALPDEAVVADLSEFFKAFGDPTRVRILLALARAELCVCDLAALLDMSHSAVSHQLRYLRVMKIVKYRREGKMAYYSLDDTHVHAVLRTGLDHVLE